MNRFIRSLLNVALIVFVLSLNIAWGADTFILRARVINLEGQPMPGAKIFLYGTPNTRKPADYITPITDDKGEVLIELPVGKYWGVARLKSDGKYGPLMPGDKHSGEPQELSASDKDTTFVVADIREMAQKKRADTSGVVRLKGRVVDGQGMPVANAYVYACRTQEHVEVPEFLSAWTDETGNYTLFVPQEGKYYLGASTNYPPGTHQAKLKEIVISKGKLDIAMDVEITVK
jgi:uncharacterized GH25 family protein